MDACAPDRGLIARVADFFEYYQILLNTFEYFLEYFWILEYFHATTNYLLYLLGSDNNALCDLKRW